MSSKNPSRRPPRHQFVKDLQSLGYEKIIGVDEVGRGALAGPLVVAAVEIYRPIPGINDSKLLTASQRESLVYQIRRSALQIAFGSASNDEIDQLGLSAAQRLAYQRALADLDFDLLLTDHIHPWGVTRFISAIKGDSLFYPVAAASIVAKVYRDQLMSVYHQFHPQYNWLQNAGYGTDQHQKMTMKHGSTALHRRSFGTRMKKGVPTGEDSVGTPKIFDLA
ncbi:MAG: ribonuclease HII [Patescibacteria group bacterium]